ncbi:MAG: ABC transporter permease subunit [Chlorobi bacterium]|nr:ABC transporter permease subunit [Chlorobiota bacterium]MCI0716420.1 ABC transporter permease subunit [Chlorobiota bacterium]
MTTVKILKYVIYDILRSRIVIGYTILLFAVTYGIIYTGKDASKAIISLLNVVMLVVPLVSIIFGTIHFYNSREFMQMMLALPVKRKNIFWAEYLGLSFALSISFTLGVGLPLLIYGASAASLYLIFSGAALSFIFTSLSFLASVINNDKTRGIGLSLIIWFYTAIIFDAIVLMIYFLFSDYPLEKFTVIISALNPIDLARILVLLKMDISALMGYTGATLRLFFGSAFGTVFSFAFLIIWILAPTAIALKVFNRKNF